MELKLPESEFQPLILELDRRITLGRLDGAPEEQVDRISLGRPACRRLSPSSLDAATRTFLKERDSVFWLLALTCSFHAIHDEPMESAWLEVQLRTTWPPGAPDPTAWSMEPSLQHDPVEISRVVKLDSSLKLTSEIVPLEIGPSAGRQVTEKYTRRQPYVEAHREGTPRPAWIFSRTPITEIRGVHRLRTVIELPTHAIAEAEICAGATLRLKRMGLISYRTRLGHVPGWILPLQ
jgi:hypothetical protein